MVPRPVYYALLLIQVGCLALIGAKAQTQTCTHEMDLAFVVDSSGSICNDEPVETCANWNALRGFIHAIIDDMIIGPNDVRVALIEFESSAWIKWNLTTYSNKSALLNAVDTLRYTGGNTNTVAALGNLSLIFNVQNGDRPEVNNTAILITDGKPRRGDDPIPLNELEAVVNRVTVDWGIRLLTVGVTGSIDMDTLKVLSSPPHTINQTVFIAEDYLSLMDVLRSLEMQNCINYTEQTPSPAPDLPLCTENLDLCFVVDASGSICDTDGNFDYYLDNTCNNWKANVDFIRSIADYFDVGYLQTRIALVIFSTTSYVAWNLTAYTDKATLLSAINNLSYYKGGSTDMSGGLRLMSTQVFNQTGDRPDVPNTCVVITDGYPTNPSTIQAEIDRIRRDAIRTLVVGVTNKVDMSTITRLASPPAQENVTYFLSYNYTTLEASVRAQLSTTTCGATPTPPGAPDIPGSPPAFPTTTPFIREITPPPRSEAPNVCNDAALDLCFLIDASGSICDTDPSFDYDTDSTCNNWNLLLQFVRNLVDNIYESPSVTRIGLIKFSSQAQTVFNLQRYTNKADILSAIDNLAYVKGGETDMTGALHLARTEVFTAPGDRPGFNNTVVIITDGYPTQPSTLQAEIDQARSSRIRIVALGVTDKVDESTLHRLSAPPQQINVTYFMALDYVNIASFSKALQDTICQ